MSAGIHITEAEYEVLAALWRHGPLPPSRLMEAVRTARPWGDATIKTLLGRLMHKQAIRSERQAGRLVYRPLIEREAFVSGQVAALVDRLFDGDQGRLRALLQCSCRTP